MAPAICPVCGEAVPPNARACPACGSDDSTGWSEEAYHSPPDVPDEDFNYNEFVAREFEGRPPSAHRLPRFWWIVALLVVVALITWALL